MIILFLMFNTSDSIAQHLVASATIEKNVAGAEYGTSVSYQTKKLLSFGGFHQTTIDRNQEGSSKRTFWGAVLNIPISSSARLNFYAQSRIGFVNGKFFSFVPGVETEVKVTGKIWINVGAGLRMTYPSLTTKLSFKI
jgi:hypothetical protein